jgi:hypothetical protein
MISFLKPRLPIAMAALAAASTVGAPAFAANLIVNGGFEEPVVEPGGFTHFRNGDNIAGWDVVGPLRGDSVQILSNTYTEPNVAFESHSGDASLDITGGGNVGPDAGVSQSIATDIGQTYRLSFWLGNADGNNNYTLPSTIAVKIDGLDLKSFTNADITPNHIDWRLVSFTFRADRDQTRVTFFNNTPRGDAEGGLDDVSLTAVPEPASWALMIGGFGLAGATLRRRKALAAA